VKVEIVRVGRDGEEIGKRRGKEREEERKREGESGEIVKR
jgi:hypothetical protein